MDLVDLVYNTLSPLKIPVMWEIRPEKPPGISYHFFNESGILFGDGETKRSIVSCQIDIWFRRKEDVNLKNKVKKTMKNAGFLEPNSYTVYDDKVNLYHTVMVFNYNYEESEDNEYN